jgi:RNA-splicing ligase RtcB
VEKVQIPTVSRPKPLQLTDVRVFVVTKDTLESFEAEFKETYGELAVVVLSMRDYENLALNIAELKRYIGQQKNIIVYYEEAVTDNPEPQVEAAQ